MSGPASASSFAHEHRAATEGCGLVRRDDRSLLRIRGRAPRRMLHGMLTNGIPDPPVAGAAADPRRDPDGAGAVPGRSGRHEGGAGGRALRGQAAYGAVLTAKGRMVTDLTTYWLGPGEADGIALAVSAVARRATAAHFARFLPPRFAQAEDLGGGAVDVQADDLGAGDVDARAGDAGAGDGGPVGPVGLLTAIGPSADEAVRSAVGDVPDEGYVLTEGGWGRGGVLVARGIEQAGPSWDIWADQKALSEIDRRLEAVGAVSVSPAVWDALRVESGFPRYGVDMDETTIPIEAGLEDRAFDHDKGCYTGQEVVVRILHRGRVNWRLCALRFGNLDAKPGDKLFEPGGAKVRGRVTSVAESPRFGQRIGLGYARREVAPPATLRLGSGEGAPVGVEALA